jgi:DNA-binding response OmpR family regulator
VDPKPRVLVADDEPAITALVADMLGWSGFDVVRAHGGAEALVLARAGRPDLDGRDACRALKMDRELAAVPVVLFSSADEQDVHWRAAGADGFLQKPFSIRGLPDFVWSFLGKPVAG